MKSKSKILIFQFLIVLFLLPTVSCSKKDATPISVTDIDGNVYNTVIIGSQTWMVENLKTTKYRNGDLIANVTDASTWSALKTGCQCSYNNDDSNIFKYGKLYNWYAVNDIRNIAPVGWHIPTDEEWSELSTNVAAIIGASNQVAKALAAKTDWTLYNGNGAVGNDLSKNNSSGFLALPSGLRSYLGDYAYIGREINWWSTTETQTDYAFSRYITFTNGDLIRDFVFKESGYSVRCIKD